MKHRVSRLVVGTLVGIGSVAMFAGAASAHVTIDTLGTVEQGSFAKLGFSVPNERSDAGTVRVSVQMPQDHPLTFVSVQPKTGWEAMTTMRTLDTPVEVFGSSVDEVVDTVTWTATAETQIGPGEFEMFWISAGVMPDGVDQLAFPTIQTYSGGEEVAWIEPVPASGEEPEHPAPTVQLVAATETPTEKPTDAVATPDGKDDDSNTLAIIALVVGIAGVLIGGLGLATARRARTATKT